MRGVSQRPPSADRRRDLEFAARALARLDEARARRLEPHAHVARGAEQQVALLGQDQAAGVAVEQRRLQFALERRDLPADTADWLRPRSSPARVKLPASATV